MNTKSPLGRVYEKSRMGYLDDDTITHFMSIIENTSTNLAAYGALQDAEYIKMQGRQLIKAAEEHASAISKRTSSIPMNASINHLDQSIKEFSAAKESSNAYITSVYTAVFIAGSAAELMSKVQTASEVFSSIAQASRSTDLNALMEALASQTQNGNKGDTSQLLNAIEEASNTLRSAGAAQIADRLNAYGSMIISAAITLADHIQTGSPSEIISKASHNLKELISEWNALCADAEIQVTAEIVSEDAVPLTGKLISDSIDIY